MGTKKKTWQERPCEFIAPIVPIVFIVFIVP